MTQEQVDIVKALFAHLAKVPSITLCADDDSGISIDGHVYISPTTVKQRTIRKEEEFPAFVVIAGEGDEFCEPNRSFAEVAKAALVFWVKLLADGTLDNLATDAWAKELQHEREQGYI